MISKTLGVAKALRLLNPVGDHSSRDVPPPSPVVYPSPVVSALVRLPSKGNSSLGKLRFRHLSLLVALDKHRNLHRAARAVHLAQPSATKTVHDLELMFGSALFERLPTGMQPTEMGAVVVAFAHRALGELTRLAADLENRRAGRDAHLVIGAANDMLPNLVALALAEIKQRRPALTLKLLGDPSEDIIDRLLDGRTDMAVGYFDGHPLVDTVACEVIGKEPLVVVARKDHPLRHEFKTGMHSLERSPWILHLRSSFPCHVVEQTNLLAGRKTPANAIESHSISMTLDLLLNTDALTILPEFAVHHYLCIEKLVRLPVTLVKDSIDFGILTRRDEALKPAAAEFSQVLRQFFLPRNP